MRMVAPSKAMVGLTQLEIRDGNATNSWETLNPLSRRKMKRWTCFAKLPTVQHLIRSYFTAMALTKSVLTFGPR